jgi:predicted NAD/FAD-dependent oxidoreductase
VDIGIVGAGLSGLAAARTLQERGYAPVVFDKGRGPGGRLSSKRTELGSLDLGAQYATAKNPEFRAAVFSWLRAEVARRWSVTPIVRPRPRKRWQPKGPARYVGIPRMGAVAHHLAEGLDRRSGVTVAAVEADDAGITVRDDNGEGLGRFDHVIVTTPAPQAQRIAPPQDGDAAAAIAAIEFAPCWVAAFDIPGCEDLPDAGFINKGPIQWLVRHGAKPEHDGESVWVVHAGPDWSREWLEASADDAAAGLWAALREQWPSLPDAPAARLAHRWRYARVLNPLERGTLTDTNGISYAGDWVADGRLEGAWLSGRRAAQRLLEPGGQK